ncbi:copper chaperone PCu(A)C [Chitinimonas sp.]|uniref:copper chaperone PCu(A)C n=1 Tax=Chitinimonas sp. TaxID=1934313 RepID=UPI002F956F53
MQYLRKTLITVASLGLLAAATAHEFKAGNLEIHHPWARATPAGTKTGAVYFKLINSGTEADALIDASAPELAASAEVHNHVNDNGVMRMRKVDKVDIPAKGSALLAPGGYHLMLMGLKQPLTEGQKLPLTLRFQRAGEVKVEVKVESLTADPTSMHAGH